MMLNSKTLEPNRAPQFYPDEQARWLGEPGRGRADGQAPHLRLGPLQRPRRAARHAPGVRETKGPDGAWLQAAVAIGRLGGNAQVFTQLNQGNTA